jgi:hypothetical protein
MHREWALTNVAQAFCCCYDAEYYQGRAKPLLLCFASHYALAVILHGCALNTNSETIELLNAGADFDFHKQSCNCPRYLRRTPSCQFIECVGAGQTPRWLALQTTVPKYALASLSYTDAWN